MNELGYWRIGGGFLSFRELDQHSAAAYLSGVLIRDSAYHLLMSFAIAFSFLIWLLLASVLHGDSGALFTFFLHHWEDFAFQVIVKACILIVVGTRRSHSTFVFSTICVLRFINNPHTLVFCLSCLSLLHCHHCSGPLAVHLGAPLEWRLVCLGASGIWEWCYYLNRDSPLHPNLCIFIDASSREPEMDFAFLLLRLVWVLSSSSIQVLRRVITWLKCMSFRYLASFKIELHPWRELHNATSRLDLMYSDSLSWEFLPRHPN